MTDRPLIRRGTRGPQLHDPERFWVSARYVNQAQECDFCGFAIPRSSPGRTTGTRGTKAYFNTLLKVWECIPCRQEALRAAAATLPDVVQRQA